LSVRVAAMGTTHSGNDGLTTGLCSSCACGENGQRDYWKMSSREQRKPVMASLKSRTSFGEANATGGKPGRNVVAVLSSGSTMTTTGTPVARYCSVLARTAPDRSSGERTSMTRSGAPVKKPRPLVGTRSRRTKAISGPRTVSGFDASLKPTSAPMVPTGCCSKWRPRSKPSRITTLPFRVIRSAAQRLD